MDPTETDAPPSPPQRPGPSGPSAVQAPLPGSTTCPFTPHPHEGIGGEILNDAESFQVDEVPAYAPTGEGDHWFVRVRKTGLTTPELRDLLAQAAGVDSRDVGVAGRKDRQAITTQWMSLPRAPVDPEHERVQILEVARHPHKLRLGHLGGNRFQVRITGVQHPERLPALVDLMQRGLPDYFGAQRFGRYGLYDGLRLCADPRRRVKDPKFLASVVQSAIFNLWLGERVRSERLHAAIEGDILRKRATGGLFVCREPEVDTPRVLAGELDPTGPMPGPKTWAAEGEAAQAEAAALDAMGLSPDMLKTLGRFAEGTRRVARIQPDDLQTEFTDPTTLVLRFTLPKGAFATVLLGFLIDPTQPFHRTEEVEG